MIEPGKTYRLYRPATREWLVAVPGDRWGQEFLVTAVWTFNREAARQIDGGTLNALMKSWAWMSECTVEAV